MPTSPRANESKLLALSYGREYYCKARAELHARIWCTWVTGQSYTNDINKGLDGEYEFLRFQKIGADQFDR
jgi:hypothetical protein